MSTIRWFFAALLLVASSATAKPLVKQWVEVKGGATAFLHGGSNVPSHRIKPVLRLEWIRSYHDDLGIGLSVVAVPDENVNYRLLGGYINIHGRLYRGDVFSMFALGGWGIGTGPRILYADLTTHETITLWGHLGLEMRWWVVRDSLMLGIDLVSENISMVSSNAVVGFHF